MQTTTKGWATLLILGLLVGCGDDVTHTPRPDGGAGQGGVAVAPPATGGGPGEGGSPDDAAIFPDPAWATGEPEDHGLDSAQLDEAAAVAEAERSYCLLVIRHGVLVYERYWQGHDASTPQKSYSIAKSYTSALVGIAIERGDIASLDQSASDFLPSWKGTPKEAITIRHLLSMTSGLSWSAFADYVSMVTFADDHSQYALELSLADEPGTGWTYHNGAVQVLEPLLEAATGMNMEQYAEQHLWSRLGMTGVSWAKDPAGNATAYASVMASCRDHARLGYLYHQGGNWAGESVIPSAWIGETLTPSQTTNRAYGYLWWLNQETPTMNAMMEPWPGRMSAVTPPDMYAARGFGNQFIDVIPSLDLLVVRFGEDPWVGFDLLALFDDARFAKHDAIIAPILAAVSRGF